jgi:tetratricopeptide (TPR) repeat protein
LEPSNSELSKLRDFIQSGKNEEAEKLAANITEQFPKHAFAWKVLGSLFTQKDRLSEALDAKQKTVDLDPGDEDSHYNLGNLLLTLGRAAEAEISYKKVIAINSDYTNAYINLAIALKQLGRFDEAETRYRQAIILRPDHVEAHINLSGILQEMGRLDEAQVILEQAIALRPDNAQAHRHFSLLKKFISRDEYYIKMQKLFLKKDISEEQRCHINFALAKASEDLGELEQAFMHYREGNAIRKNLLGYDISQDVIIFKQLKASYSRIEEESLKLDHSVNKPIPIFIVGMPRSGTTLVEQIITSHSQVEGKGELPFVAQFGEAIARGLSLINNESLSNFRDNYLAKLQNTHNDNLIITDKMPQNFRFIGLLTAVFPEAKIVHVKRNPAALCWGNYKQYFSSKSQGYSYALDDVIKYYDLYKNLMEFWTKEIPDRIYNVDYELLTVNQEDETRKLINFIDLDWEDKCLFPQNNTRNIATASNIQIREKVYQDSSEKWKKYKPFLNGLLDCIIE